MIFETGLTRLRSTSSASFAPARGIADFTKRIDLLALRKGAVDAAC